MGDAKQRYALHAQHAILYTALYNPFKLQSSLVTNLTVNKNK